jgi:hypothetical protein
MLPHVAVQVAPTLAVNCCCAFSLNVFVSGEIAKVSGGPTVSVIVAVYAAPFDAVAVMMQLPC